MYYNDDFRSRDQYRYTNRDQLPRDDYAPDPNRVPVQPKKQGFFHRSAVKVTALILACAVAGGLAGWGGAAIAKAAAPKRPPSSRAIASRCRCRSRPWTARPKWSRRRCTPPW